MDGMLVEVEAPTRSSHATQTQAIGDSTVTVEDDTLFAENGGRLDIAGVQYDYTSVDTTANVITLTTPLTVAVALYDPVSVVAGGIVAQDFNAVVDLGEGHNVTVSIPYALRSQFLVGPYTPQLPVKVSDDLSELLEVDGQQPGNMQITDATGRVVWSGEDGPMKPQYLNVQVDGFTFTNSWVTHDLGTITPPAGYTNVTFWVWVSAGTTFTDAGNIAVQPYVKDTSGVIAAGTPIANGVPYNGGPCSSSSMFAQGASGQSVGNPLTFGADVNQAGPATTGAGNLHISVLALFTR